MTAFNLSYFYLLLCSFRINSSRYFVRSPLDFIRLYTSEITYLVDTTLYLELPHSLNKNFFPRPSSIFLKLHTPRINHPTNVLCR